MIFKLSYYPISGLSDVSFCSLGSYWVCGDKGKFSSFLRLSSELILVSDPISRLFFYVVGGYSDCSGFYFASYFIFLISR